MPETVAVWVSIYAALVGTSSLVWQVLSWVRSRRPEVSVTARHEASKRGRRFGINVKVVPNTDITVVRAGIAPWERHWKPLLQQLYVNRWSVNGGPWQTDSDEVGRGLPRGIRATEVLNIWFSQDEVTGTGLIGFKDERDYVAWVETSRGHLHRSNIFGGGTDETWVKWSDDSEDDSEE